MFASNGVARQCKTADKDNAARVMFAAKFVAPRIFPVVRVRAVRQNRCMWRIITIAVISFWLLMSSLLVRYTWFPDGTRFSQVPPRLVLQQFLQQGSAESSAGTFHVYRGERKIGHASVSVRRMRDTSTPDYAVRLDGTFTKDAFPTLEENISWGMTLKLLDIENFGEARGHVRLEGSRATLNFTWERGQRLPRLAFRSQSTQMDEAMITAMMQQMLGAGPDSAVAQQLGIDPQSKVDTIITLKARESVMDFSGQKNKGHTLELNALDRWKARAFFTEAGELALIDLPDGYRLVEPVIHGLTPDYDEDEEEMLE